MAASKPLPDLRGQKIGKRTILGLAPSSSHNVRYFARCDCGHVGPVFRKEILKGKNLACRSCSRREMLRRSYREKIGQTFGQRTLIDVIDTPKGAAEGYVYVLTKCSCGYIAPVVGSVLLKGLSTKCVACNGKKWRGTYRGPVRHAMECQPCA